MPNHNLFWGENRFGYPLGTPVPSRDTLFLQDPDDPDRLVWGPNPWKILVGSQIAPDGGWAIATSWATGVPLVSIGEIPLKDTWGENDLGIKPGTPLPDKNIFSTGFLRDDDPLVLEKRFANELAKNTPINTQDESKNYHYQMVIGSNTVKEKITIEKAKTISETVLKKAGTFGAIATGIPALGISTAIGTLLGGVVGLLELFSSKDKKENKATLINRFIKKLLPDSTYQEIGKYKWLRINKKLSKSEALKFLDGIKQSFTGTDLENAADSLILSDESILKYKINVFQFTIDDNIPKITKMDIKKLGLIGAGLLALKLLIFKG